MALGERRFRYSTPKAQKVEYQWNDAGRPTINLVGELTDFSPSGARLLLDQHLPVNTSIQVALDNQEWRTGKVRYCLRRMRGYAIGIHFDAR